jgi:FAD-linked sulfhydryl oxidase
MTKKSPSTATSPSTSTHSPHPTSTDTTQPPPDCPPDVDALGTSTWTLLHTLTATYPPTATPQHQSQMSQFLTLFSQLYPCWVCADDFRAWMKTKGNEPRLEGRDVFGRWMCEAHNEVNRKLGKEVFECGKWEERWRTGWKDGRCD